MPDMITKSWHNTKCFQPEDDDGKSWHAQITLKLWTWASEKEKWRLVSKREQVSRKMLLIYGWQPSFKAVLEIKKKGF